MNSLCIQPQTSFNSVTFCCSPVMILSSLCTVSVVSKFYLFVCSRFREKLGVKTVKALKRNNNSVTHAAIDMLCALMCVSIT